MRKSRITLSYRRKRKGLTNYKRRLKLLLANKPRLVIRKSLKSISAQVVEYEKEGDKVLVSVHSNNLGKFGWKTYQSNLPTAYLVGLLAGKKAKEKGIKELIVDIGFNKSVKGSKIYALLKGVIDSGINIPHSGEMLPKEERIKGEHISKYASELKNDHENYKKKFGQYLKNDVDPTAITKYFEITKNKIMGV